MVTFSCENCGDALAKKKLDQHSRQCYGASYSCLDCGVHFQRGSWRSHTSCISEEQKTHGALFKDKKKPNSDKDQNTLHASMATALVPRNAYVEDAPDLDSGTIAIVDAPPRAPSPPPAAINVFDFLMPDDGSVKRHRDDASKALPSPDDPEGMGNGEQDHDTWYDIEELPAEDDAMQYEANEYVSAKERPYGYEYGHGPVMPAGERYDSFNYGQAGDSVQGAFQTPAPRRDISARGHAHKDSTDSTAKKSGKRKRGHPDGIDLSATRTLQPAAALHGDIVMTDVAPGLHSGLTGGLSRLMSSRNGNTFPLPPSPEISGEGEGLGESPLSPLKKQKHGNLHVSRFDKENRREKKSKPILKRKVPASHVRLDFSASGTRRDRDGRSPAVNPDKDMVRDGSGERRRRRRRDRSRSPRLSLDSHADKLKAIEYNPRSDSPNPNATNAMIRRDPGTVALRTELSAQARADLFMSFITKGPESERGCSINKALKRYHRERFGKKHEDDNDNDRGRRDSGAGGSESRKRRRDEREKKTEERADEEKELWKSLRLKKNDRGEIVLFFDEREA